MVKTHIDLKIMENLHLNLEMKLETQEQQLQQLIGLIKKFQQLNYIMIEQLGQKNQLQ